MNSFINSDFYISKLELACYVLPGCNNPTHRNRPNHGFAYLCDGTLIYDFFDGEKITVNPGELIYLPKNSNYNVIIKSDSSVSEGCYAINFDIDNTFLMEPFKLLPRNGNEFLQLFRLAEKRWRERKTGYIQQVLSNCYDIIALIKIEMDREYIANSKAQMIKPALSYICDHYTNEIITVPYLAGLCNLSEVYFRKIFKSVYGIPPCKYIQNIKLTRAADLLKSGLYNVHDVAQMSGFFDDSYFSREFKKIYNITPKQYISDC